MKPLVRWDEAKAPFFSGGMSQNICSRNKFGSNPRLLGYNRQKISIEQDLLTLFKRVFTWVPLGQQERFQANVGIRRGLSSPLDKVERETIYEQVWSVWASHRERERHWSPDMKEYLQTTWKEDVNLRIITMTKRSFRCPFQKRSWMWDTVRWNNFLYFFRKRMVWNPWSERVIIEDIFYWKWCFGPGTGRDVLRPCQSYKIDIGTS